jgi:alpha-tubulin suppressor-like RCC1 family protein
VSHVSFHTNAQNFSEDTMKDVVRVLCLCLVMLISSRGAASADVVGAGYEHSVYLSSTGHVWTWGRNYYGQLGVSGGNRSTPVQVSISGVVAIAAGSYHTLALKSDGTVWGWGENWGKLGDGTQTNRDHPVRAGTLTDIVAICAGETQSLALQSDGTVWAFGLNIYGDLGEGTGNEYDSPTAISGFYGVSALGCGSWHTMGIYATGGYVYSTGYNGFGQLGRSSGSYSTPGQMDVVSGVGAVAGGFDFSLMLLTDHTLYGTGSNNYGQLGNGQSGASATPSSITMPDDIAMIAAGYRHSLAVTTNGTLYVWGLNDWGQLGIGNTTNQGYPVANTGVGSYAVVSVAGGQAHSVVLMSDGTVYAWGLNNYGQLGDGTTTASSSPVTVSAPLGGW